MLSRLHMDIDEDLTSDNLHNSPSTALPSESPIDQSEIDELLIKYPYASEPTYFTRPNRYHGPASTWRSYTAEDRAVADSLDVARAENLSVHLYNAFDLKRRSRAVRASKTAQGGNEVDGGANVDNGQKAASEEFTPPDVWTAWPLRCRHVPRDSESMTTATSARARAEASLPSTSLADALLAITLRHAKESWDARTKELKPAEPRASKHDWENERDLTKKEMKSQGTNEELDDTTNHQSPSSSDTTDSEAISIADENAALTARLPPGTQLFSSQAFATSDSSSSEDETSTTGSEEDEPVFSADDDHARQLLQPSIRHIMSRFDDLLNGLHEARAAYALKGDDSRSRSRSRFSGPETTEDDQCIRSGSRAASVKRGRKRKRVPSESQETGEQQTSRSRGRSTVKKSDKKSQPYALRDWSDIMGMAILKGWNVETVARASERCARLFGQNMAFRTFHQGTTETVSASQKEPWFEETLAYVPVEHESHVQDLSRDMHDESRPALKPQSTGYIRTSSRCSRCESLKIRCQPLDPLSIDDLTKRVPCSACSSLRPIEALCSGILVQPKPNPTAKTCPYPDCPRHNPAKSFLKKYHLQRHLTDVHGHVYSPPTSPAPSTPVHHEYLWGARDTPEHVRLNATLSCPVVSCPQSQHVYKRSTRLYDHIRKAHPEFDVNALKKVVGRGGEKGRYDRSRSRSRLARIREKDDSTEHDDDPKKDEEQGGGSQVEGGLDDDMQTGDSDDN